MRIGLIALGAVLCMSQPIGAEEGIPLIDAVRQGETDLMRSMS